MCAILFVCQGEYDHTQYSENLDPGGFFFWLELWDKSEEMNTSAHMQEAKIETKSIIFSFFFPFVFICPINWTELWKMRNFLVPTSPGSVVFSYNGVKFRI